MGPWFSSDGICLGVLYFFSGGYLVTKLYLVTATATGR